MIPPRRPYVMTSPSGCSTKSAAGNNSAPVVPPPTLLKLSPNSIDLGYHTMVRIFKVSMLKMSFRLVLIFFFNVPATIVP